MAKSIPALALLTIISLPLAAQNESSGFNLIYTFVGAGTYAPWYGQMPLGSSGELYGTTYGDGAGTIFVLTPPAAPGDSWTETTIYNFLGGTDGANPAAMPTLARNGVLFGTTVGSQKSASCSGGCGTVYRLTPGAEGSWKDCFVQL
jgi:hypothetical protein